MDSATPQLEPLNVQNLRDHSVQRIRRAILRGTYGLGERLVESSIADQLGVSRAPVREALASLEREGVVARIPRRGYFVVDFSEKDIKEVYSLRLLLESEALRRAIDRATEENLCELQGFVDELGEAALRQDEPETIVELDLAFHARFCRLADHSRLCSAWENLRVQTQLLIGITSRTHYASPDQPREWHQRILDTFRAKDLDCAQEILAEHTFDAQKRALQALQSLHSIPSGEVT